MATASYTCRRGSVAEWTTPFSGLDTTKLRGVLVVAAIYIVCSIGSGMAATMEAALVSAYQVNPQINAQRALVRSTDENVPQALSGYRPRVAITASGGAQFTELGQDSGRGSLVVSRSLQTPATVGATVSQLIYNGQQTGNRVRATESQVLGARATLSALEQSVLLSAATIYMDYLRDSAVVEVQRSNVRVLTENLGQTRDRFKVGDVTTTDVAQSEAQLAAGQTQLLTSESNLTSTRSNFRRIIGMEPAALIATSPVDRFLPSTLANAISKGLDANPNITAATFGVDVSALQVKIGEGALLPTLSVQATVQQAYQPQIFYDRQFNASAVAQLSIPIYQGGAEYAVIRQSKENLTQQRLSLEQVRDQVRATIVQAWGQLLAARSQIQSTTAQVRASEVALNGVRDEARFGQRTTYDVLVAQQTLVNARVNLVAAQHDRVVASYAVLSSVGMLTPAVLNLNTQLYDPSVHYHQVRNKLVGSNVASGK